MRGLQHVRLSGDLSVGVGDSIKEAVRNGASDDALYADPVSAGGVLRIAPGGTTEGGGAEEDIPRVALQNDVVALQDRCGLGRRRTALSYIRSDTRVCLVTSRFNR